MTESAYSSIHGAEISERSAELVLPSSPAGGARSEIEDRGAASSDATAKTWRTAPLVSGAGTEQPDAERAASPERESAAPIPPASGDGLGTQATARFTHDPDFTKPPGEPLPSPGRGQALPGDRGPRDVEAGSQRPSFWRRIALGRRAQSLRNAPDGDEPESRSAEANAPSRNHGNGEGEIAIGQVLAARRALATRDADALVAKANESVERRIVEPLLQALVSVEAKLERSHVDLVGRSDQVEQRLTQLWDIEEQLGALGELQESVLHVTEQQRRLEAALVAQTRILRWLVGGIILSLAVAAFSVAFFLRVSG